MSSESIRILIVDDDEVDRLTIAKCLEDAGFTVSTDEEPDGSKAAARVASTEYDCVFLDYQLPGITGLDVLNEIRQMGSEVPIIVTTGQGDEDLVVQLLRAGASDYLNKEHLSPARLKRCLRYTLRASRSESREAELQAEIEAERLVLRGVMEQMPLGVVVADPESGAIRFCNARFKELLGNSAFDETVNFTASVSQEKISTKEWPLHQTFNGAPGPLEKTILVARADGSEITVRAIAKLVADVGGHPLASVMTLQDITSASEERESMQESLNIGETLVEVGESIAAELDSRSLVRALLKKATKLADADFGLIWLADDSTTEEDFLVQGDLLEDRPAIEMTLRKFIAAKSDELTLQYLSPEKASKVHPLVNSILIAPLIDRDSKVNGSLVLGSLAPNRFSEREEQLLAGLAKWGGLALSNARLFAEAQRATHLREETLAIVSHDLRSPLNAIAIAAEQIGDPSLGPDELERFTGAIQRGVKRSVRLINELLDVARIEAGGFSVNPASTSAQKVVAESIRSASMLAEKKSIQLKTDLPAEELLVMADERRLRQVFDNLLGNAIRYAPKDGRVTVGAQRSGSSIVFSVKDNGAGIPEATLPHLFDRFWQAADKKKGAAGLGLAIVRGIVDAHGGTVHVESQEGVGTEFLITIAGA